MNKLVSVERIERKIYLIRGQKVMLDRDLAELYCVKTKVLNQAVKRNNYRFPEDFMFQLSKAEFENLRSQIVTSSWGGVRRRPFVFTEHGILMLSSVLSSRRAIYVNIQIMRTFTRLRRILVTHKELKEKIDKLESRYERQFKVVFDAIRELMKPDNKGDKKIGFRC